MASREEIIMRRRLRSDFWLLALLVAVFVPGAFLGACVGTTEKGSPKGVPTFTPEADDGLDVFFRDASLSSLSDQALPEYPDADAGESTKIARDFPDAPPQIPHAVEEMFPITLAGNECLECHLPENATGDDVPLPDSHFKAPVMGKGAVDQPMAWVVKDYQQTQDVMGARYSCNMCHTPQATNVSTPKNSFEPPRSGM
jgi:nitrate reductase cytochrome c-type subunit